MVRSMRPVGTKHPDSWIEQAPDRCSAEREIAASPNAIWEALADHESWPKWFDAVKSVAVTGAAAGVGARRRVSLPGLDIEEEFVGWDVGERFAFRAVALSRGIFESINERVTIEALEDGRSLVTYIQAFAPTWWFRLPFKLARGQFGRNLDGALQGLAARVE
ncbi:MAG: SRPBCC family protein [Solirubrobacterales bacterium]